jgi:hypothetical protein
MYAMRLAAFGCLVALGCSSGNEPDPPPSVVRSESGALEAELIKPSAVERGANRFELELRDASTGAAAAGLEVSVVPFMPAMGHGSGVSPEVSSLAEGHYECTQVLLNMAGRWQLRTTISGVRSDYVAFEVDVP